MKDAAIIFRISLKLIKKNLIFYSMIVLLNFSVNIAVNKALIQFDGSTYNPKLMFLGLISVLVSWFTYCGTGSAWIYHDLNWKYIARVFKRLPDLLYFGVWYFFNFTYRIFLLVFPAIQFALKNFFTVHILIHENTDLASARNLSEQLVSSKKKFIFIFVLIMYSASLWWSVVSLEIFGDSSLRLFAVSCLTAFINISFGTYYFIMKNAFLKTVEKELLKRSKNEETEHNDIPKNDVDEKK
ncbi:MAG: hypothetical protein CSB55_06590 [Candidatus Cloacimonadota bacterium]|nr:MAG: hypothetical protein CSB55_06590 [Candidatus Cloacimonadota bacterium]